MLRILYTGQVKDRLLTWQLEKGIGDPLIE